MAEELGSNVFFRGAGRRRSRLAVAASIAVAVAAIVVAIVHPLLAGEGLLGRPRYVSLINHGQLQVCRVGPAGVVCPPLSSSLSQSYRASQSYSESESYSESKSYSASASKSKSYSSSRSVSTSTSLSPSVRTQ